MILSVFRSEEDFGAAGGAMQEDAKQLTGHSYEEAASLLLEEFPPHQLTVCAALVSAALSEIYTDHYKIGVPEWRILVTLGQVRSVTGRDLGKSGHMHKTKVSRAVAVLEARGWLSRQANLDDRREAICFLTSEGDKVYRELARLAVDFTRRLWNVLDPEEQAIFDGAICKLSARARELKIQKSMNGEIET
jgi:DNA-binding MarR family transcriptional regulator